MAGGEDDERRGGKRRAPRPLDAPRLEELAMHYVARFATSRAKLRLYLVRKLRERGWVGADPPDPDALVARMVSLGFVDDRAFAAARTQSLLRRGYGKARVRAALSQAGIDEDDRLEAAAIADSGEWDAALRYAERRRIGPFSAEMSDPRARDKALAAMIRAGHSFEIARKIMAMKDVE